MQSIGSHFDPQLPGFELRHDLGRASSHAPPPSHDGLWLPDLLRVLARRWRIVAGCAAGGLLVAATACVLTQRLYTATAVLHVENLPPQVVSAIAQVVAPPTYLEGFEFFQDQIQALQSRALAARTLRALDLEADDLLAAGSGPSALRRWLPTTLRESVAWLYLEARGQIHSLLLLISPPLSDDPAAEPTEPSGVPSAILDRYQSWLDVSPVTNSRMIRVSFTSPSASLSQRLATGHAQQFIRASLQSKFEMTGEARHFLEAEIARVERELDTAERALSDFRRSHQVVSLDEKENAIVERLTDLARRVTEAEADRISAEADYRIGARRELDSLPVVLQNPLIQTLKAEVSRLEIRHAEQGEIFLPASPQMQEISSQLRQARRRLDTEIARVVGGIESVYLASQTREASLRDELVRQQAAVLDLKDATASYIKLEQGVLATRHLYSTLVTRLQETDVVKGVQLSNATIVDRAELPTAPSHPRVGLTLGFGLMLGLGLGGLATLLAEHLDRSVKTPEDVRRTLGLPTLGVVPDFGALAPRGGAKASLALPAPPASTKGGRERLAAPKGELVSLLQRRSASAEAYRGLRTSLFICNAGRPTRLMLFTSSQSGEGKTATAVNLAVSLAQLGTRVVLVDADLRQPRCHRLLGIPAHPGLSEVLNGALELDEVVQRMDLVSGVVASGRDLPAVDCPLDLLQSGWPPADAATLLASPRMRDTLRSLAERYEMAIVDAPPMFPIADSSILAAQVDGVVLVVRGQRTDREITREALERLRFVNANVVGVVLNGIDPRLGDYYRFAHYFANTYAS